jgi:hypothetical protein
MQMSMKKFEREVTTAERAFATKQRFKQGWAIGERAVKAQNKKATHC